LSLSFCRQRGKWARETGRWSGKQTAVVSHAAHGGRSGKECQIHYRGAEKIETEILRVRVLTYQSSLGDGKSSWSRAAASKGVGVTQSLEAVSEPEMLRMPSMREWKKQRRSGLRTSSRHRILSKMLQGGISLPIILSRLSGMQSCVICLCLSLSISVCLCLCPCPCLCQCRSMSANVCLSRSLSVCLSACLSACLSVCLSACPSVSLPACLSVPV